MCPGYAPNQLSTPEAADGEQAFWVDGNPKAPRQAQRFADAGIALPPLGKVIFAENFNQGLGAFRGGKGGCGQDRGNLLRRELLNCWLFAQPHDQAIHDRVAMREKSIEMQSAPMRPMASGRSMSAPCPMPHASGDMASAVARESSESAAAGGGRNAPNASSMLAPSAVMVHEVEHEDAIPRHDADPMMAPRNSRCSASCRSTPARLPPWRSRRAACG